MEQIKDTTSKRSDLLIILCVLSFLAIGCHFIAEGISLLFSDQFQQVIVNMAQTNNPEAAAEFQNEFNQDVDSGYKNLPSILNITFNILCLVAVIMMWNQKMKGWYLYCIAEALPILVSIIQLICIGTNHIVYAVFEIISIIALDAVFAYLYYRQLKSIS